MATVTGVTKAKVDEIAGDIIVGASRSGTTLVFTKENGETIQVPNAFPAPHMSYAVGQILMTDRSENPATYLGGGTWARWGQGRVPVSIDDAAGQPFQGNGATGGVREVTLGIPNMPSHSHGGGTGWQSHDHTHTGYAHPNGSHTHGEYRPYNRTVANGAATGADSSGYIAQTDPAGYHDHSVTTNGVSQNHYHGITAEGGGQAFSILQPYITCYMWKKTSDNTA